MAEIARSIAVPLDQALPANSEEATLVAELQAGSEEAFGYLMSVYRNPVYNMVYHITGDEADAADVLQNVFVKIIRGVKQFRSGSSLKTWMYRIAVHEALNYKRGWFRRHMREAFSLDDENHEYSAAHGSNGRSEDDPFQVVEQHEKQQIVGKALKSLAEPYRTVVVLREIENLSYDEIGEVLGVAEGTVKSRLKRGRELLRRKLLGSAVTWNS
jgi:RNA polymerase sigma-70 factor, ECF subfamily